MLNSEHNSNGLNLPDSVWQILNSGDNLGFRQGENAQPTFDDLAAAIEQTMVQAKNAAAHHVYNDQLLAYWNNGRMIVIYEQNGRDRAKYGDRTLLRLSKRLTDRLGRGFSRTNLQYMRLLYVKHPKYQTLSGKLSFSHYCEVLDLDNDEKRSFYEHEAANSGWSVRELRRQMDSLLYERVLNAKDNAGQEYIKALANKGVVYSQPSDTLRSPVVLEFLDLPNDAVPLERDLQKALISQIEKFMLELGRGFMFVGSNIRIPVGSDKDYADMVFYCKPLRAYVITELKSTKLLASAVGQTNEYLNYYATEVNDEYDNPPIGIILCTDKNNIRAEYALGGLSNAIFASTYTLKLPNKEQLENQLRETLEANEYKALISN